MKHLLGFALALAALFALTPVVKAQTFNPAPNTVVYCGAGDEECNGGPINKGCTSCHSVIPNLPPIVRPDPPQPGKPCDSLLSCTGIGEQSMKVIFGTGAGTGSLTLATPGHTDAPTSVVVDSTLSAIMYWANGDRAWTNLYPYNTSDSQSSADFSVTVQGYWYDQDDNEQPPYIVVGAGASCTNPTKRTLNIWNVGATYTNSTFTQIQPARLNLPWNVPSFEYSQYLDGDIIVFGVQDYDYTDFGPLSCSPAASCRVDYNPPYSSVGWPYFPSSGINAIQVVALAHAWWFGGQTNQWRWFGDDRPWE